MRPVVELSAGSIIRSKLTAQTTDDHSVLAIDVRVQSLSQPRHRLHFQSRMTSSSSSPFTGQHHFLDGQEVGDEQNLIPRKTMNVRDGTDSLQSLPVS